MLEQIGPGRPTISQPDLDVCALVHGVLQKNPAPVVAEIGVGIGATTLPIAEIMANRGTIHIFDFEFRTSELTSDLAERGFSNIVPHGNSQRHWDSYHWSLAKLLDQYPKGNLFDIAYIDGSHTYLHDALAFAQCHRLLKPGGFMVFDDYGWSYTRSRFMAENRDSIMTPEQEGSKQIEMVVNHLVRPSGEYIEIAPNKVFVKARPLLRSVAVSRGAQEIERWRKEIVGRLNNPKIEAPQPKRKKKKLLSQMLSR